MKSDLSDIEKTAIVRLLGEGYTPLIISKQLKRDHRTVKKFIKNSQNISQYLFARNFHVQCTLCPNLLGKYEKYKFQANF